MDTWKKAFRTISVLTSIIVILLFIVFVFNQFAQLYNNIKGFNETLATLIIFLLSFLIVGTITFSILSFIRYPQVLELPDSPGDEEYKKHVFSVYNRLKRNKILNEIGFEWSGKISTEEIYRAYDALHQYSDEIILKNGNSVFLTTAISQNGVLDGIVVLLTLIKMIWQITQVYEGRPSIPRIIYLYTRVVGVVFVARSIEDFDLIEEQIEPIIGSVIGGSVLSLVPGSVQITNLIINSLMEGSVNALLTLRVGIVTRKYITALTKPSTSFLRRSASMQAVGMLGGIMKENSIAIVKSFVNAVKKSGISTASKYNPFRERM